MRKTLHSMPRDPERWPHGVRSRYARGCRCQLCRTANTQYEIHRAKERKAGRKNDIVSAAEARAYMWAMSELFQVGRRAFVQASGVADTTIQLIRNGQKPKIRRQTAEKILAVTIDALRPHALVPADQAQQMIQVLLKNGYSKARLARLLGLSTPALQFRSEQMLKTTVEKVREMFQREIARMSGAS